MVSKPRETEAEAYAFIKASLKTLKWDTRNPSRVDGGRVWTQNQCLADQEIHRLLGDTRPENIVKVTETVLWVIEAKRSHKQLEQAFSEAINDYAKPLNKGDKYKAVFVSGVAGNDQDSYLIKNGFIDGGTVKPITMNGSPTTGLLTELQLRHILDTGKPDIADPQIDEKLFRDTAERISAILHLGAIPPHRRAGVMAALLLAMVNDTPPRHRIPVGISSCP